MCRMLQQASSRVRGGARVVPLLPYPQPAGRVFLSKLMFGFRSFDDDRNAIGRSRSDSLRFRERVQSHDVFTVFLES